MMWFMHLDMRPGSCCALFWTLSFGKFFFLVCFKTLRSQCVSRCFTQVKSVSGQALAFFFRGKKRKTKQKKKQRDCQGNTKAPRITTVGLEETETCVEAMDHQPGRQHEGDGFNSADGRQTQQMAIFENRMSVSVLWNQATSALISKSLNCVSVSHHH